MVRLEPDAPTARMTGAPIIEYFRRDQRRVFRHVFVRGALLVALGGSVVAWGLLHRMTGLGSLATFVGVFVVMSGPLTTILGLRKLLLEESYVAVRRDGLVLHREDTGQPLLVVVPWDAIVRFAVDAATGGVRIEREGDKAIVVDMQLDGIATPDLVRRLESHRLRAAHGLLR